MDIIKRLSNIKTGRNLIIYDDLTFKNNITKRNHSNKNIYTLSFSEKEIEKFKKTHNLEEWMDANVFDVYQVYYGNIYNPPFFNNIIVLKRILSDENLKQLWNMTLYGGYIIISTKFNRLFKNSIVNQNDEYTVVQKKLRLTYQFPEYRVLEFIIAGVMKSGTTAMITNLGKHPDISMVEKEIHFFDDKRTYQKGMDWYKSHFDYSKRMTGDKAPDVMYQTSCLELLQLANPQVKIIISLRNPIARAYSHWKMLRDEFRDTRSFESTVKNEIKFKWGENRLYKISFRSQILQRGLYYEQIKEILKYFPKDNLLILISEKVLEDMDREYSKVYKFLDLREYHSKRYIKEFVSKNPDTLDENGKLYKFLKKLYKEDVDNLEQFLGYKTGWW